MDKLHIARTLFDFGIGIVVGLGQMIMYPSPLDGGFEFGLGTDDDRIG